VTELARLGLIGLVHSQAVRFPLRVSLPAAAMLAWICSGNCVLATTLTVTNPGDDHVTGQLSLREATASSAAGDIIVFQVRGRVKLYRGQILIDHDLTIQGPQIVQADHPPNGVSTGIFRVSNGTVNISNLTLTFGWAEGTNATATTAAGHGQGGAISNSGFLRVTDCEFVTNHAQGGQGFGGATGVESSGPGQGQGGAIYNAGTLEARRCLFSSNGVSGGSQAPAGFRGADAAGGAIYNTGAATIINCTFEGNNVLGGNGGLGPSALPAGTGKAGALFNVGSLTLKSATICNNHTAGGSAYISGDCFGGGLIPSENGVGQTTLENTIVAKNFTISRTGPPSDPPGNDVYGSVVSLGHNLIGIPSGSTGWQPTDLLGQDPLVQRYAHNHGSPTRALALRRGSPAIDRGVSSGLTTDQRGLARTYDDPAVANAAGSDGTDIGAFELQPAPAALLENLSARLQSMSGDGVLIGGLTITGSAPKRVLFRAVGAQLFGSGLSGVMSDPTLELRSADGRVIATNDDWRQSQGAEIDEIGLYPLSDKDPAILLSLDPGAYTAIVRGTNGSTGVTLFEAYDIDPSASSRLVNLSVRGRVGTSNNVVIDGFMLSGGGGGTTKIVLRVLGPSLNNFNFGALQNPVLELHDDYGTLVDSNDNWKDTQQAEIAATGLAPTHDNESAMVKDLPPGGYTAIASGRNETTGVALVEVYKLE
jgi:hypothetical protein